MTDPGRAARLWLAFTIAMLWMVTLGSELETGPTEVLELPDLGSLLDRAKIGRRRRIRLSCLGS
jgi:hypothetical protein